MTIKSIYQVEKDVVEELSNKIKEEIMSLIRRAHLQNKTTIAYTFPLDEKQHFSNSSWNYDENERTFMANNEQIMLNVMGHLDINAYKIVHSGSDNILISWDSKEERDRKEKETQHDFNVFILYGTIITALWFAVAWNYL